MVLWLGPHAPNARAQSSIPYQGTRSHMQQLNIPHAATKTQCSQINTHLFVCLFVFKERRYLGDIRALFGSHVPQGLSWKAQAWLIIVLKSQAKSTSLGSPHVLIETYHVVPMWLPNYIFDHFLNTAALSLHDSRTFHMFLLGNLLRYLKKKKKRLKNKVF